MAKNSNIWFAFNFADWFGGTRLLTPSQKGIYIDLLASIYEEGGPIERNDICLSRLCGTGIKNFQTVLEYLIKTGKIVEKDGRLDNHRAGKELKRQAKLSKKGRKLAENRWGKKDEPEHEIHEQNQHNSDARSDAAAHDNEKREINPKRPLKKEGAGREKPEQNQLDLDANLQSTEEREESQVSKNPKTSLNPSPSHIRVEREIFTEARQAEFWKAYPRRAGSTNKALTVERISKLLSTGAIKFSDLLSATNAFRKQQETMNRIGTEYVPMASTWINEKRWKDFETAKPNGNHGKPLDRQLRHALGDPIQNHYFEIGYLHFNEETMWAEWTDKGLASPEYKKLHEGKL